MSDVFVTTSSIIAMACAILFISLLALLGGGENIAMMLFQSLCGMDISVLYVQLNPWQRVKLCGFAVLSVYGCRLIPCPFEHPVTRVNKKSIFKIFIYGACS